MHISNLYLNRIFQRLLLCVIVVLGIIALSAKPAKAISVLKNPQLSISSGSWIHFHEQPFKKYWKNRPCFGTGIIIRSESSLQFVGHFVYTKLFIQQSWSKNDYYRGDLDQNGTLELMNGEFKGHLSMYEFSLEARWFLKDPNRYKSKLLPYLGFGMGKVMLRQSEIRIIVDIANPSSESWTNVLAAEASNHSRTVVYSTLGLNKRISRKLSISFDTRLTALLAEETPSSGLEHSIYKGDSVVSLLIRAGINIKLGRTER